MEAAKNINSVAAEETNRGYLTLKKYLFFGLTLSFLISLTSISFAWDAATEVRRLNKEAPSIDGFSGSGALIWLKNNEFKMLNDGSMENNRQTIILIGENIPETLKTIKLPVPAEGSVEVLEASWYNPMTGLKEGTLNVRDEQLDGGALAKVIQPTNEVVGRAIVLNVKEVQKKRYGVDSTIEMAGILPVWEQVVTVETPEGLELNWIARDVKEPVIMKNKGTQSYKWQVMNQAPWAGKGFVVYKRPSLTFSSKKGVEQSLKEMKVLADSIPTLPFPIELSSNAEKAGISLMEWMQNPSRTLTNYPSNWVRTTEQIPAKGPWTPWEKTLILNKWLKKLGWDTKVWWQTESELDKDSPASRTTWTAPVLNIHTAKGKQEQYQAGQAADFGVIAPNLVGTTLYVHNDKVEEKGYEKKRISSGNPSDHKLELLWLLEMDENGVAQGTLDFTATGGWTVLLSSGNMPEKENLSEFISSHINFALPGLQLIPIGVSPKKAGYNMKFNVKCPAGILHANNLLLRLPGGIPVRVGEMIVESTNYTLRFPFIMDQKVRMQMPKGYNLLMEPSVKKLGVGSKAVLNESINHWPKKAQLVADSTWVVKTTSIDSNLALTMRDELNACLRWPLLDLPFRKGK